MITFRSLQLLQLKQQEPHSSMTGCTKNEQFISKELDKLGADTILADPHRFYITGPTKLKAAEIIAPPALRPAAIILIGMLGASGTSVLRNIYSINRGYEDIIKRLNDLGAKIKIL